MGRAALDGDVQIRLRRHLVGRTDVEVRHIAAVLAVCGSIDFEAALLADGYREADVFDLC